jgi:hypothetical protein
MWSTRFRQMFRRTLGHGHGHAHAHMAGVGSTGKPRELAIAAWLGVSAAALIAVSTFENAAARADAWPIATSSGAPPASVAPRARAVETAIAPRSATDKAPRTSVPIARAPAEKGDAIAAENKTSAVVPDLKGKRLSVARHEARKLGLVVTARDDYGERIDWDEARYYRVRRQLTMVGTSVAPGSAIEVRVRLMGEAASGY